MPDKPATVAAYAAGASLAAITLFYVFGPTFFIDGENASHWSSGRKRGAIGLSNPANDCFINSVLQALAGLGDLRLYLIRELHRRELGGQEIYEDVPGRGHDSTEVDKPNKILDLQRGPVTRSIKDMLDALNERPIYKKTISARPFIEALERAFRTRISRNQQDAQEFLQIVAERLCDEYHAAVDARKRAVARREKKTDEEDTGHRISKDLDVEQLGVQNNTFQGGTKVSSEQDLEGALLLDEEEGFPFEGRLESQIQCQFCRFRNKPSRSNFVTLTLNVPQKSSTTLDTCFDILLKTEEIQDFKCDKCRLDHALEIKSKELRRAKSEKQTADVETDIHLLRKALKDDPECPPEGVELPPLERAPKRSIKRYMRITSFPKLLAIHLSRSIFDPGSVSLKNAAKVSFPERLRLGGILDEKWYKLLGIVCHKGNHNSGHYESFRRNHLYPPFATPDVFGAYAARSKSGSKVVSPDPSPKIGASARISEDVGSGPSIGSEGSPIISTPSISSTSLSSPPPSRPSSKQFLGPAMASAPQESVISDQADPPSCPRPSRSESWRPGSSVSNIKSDTSGKTRFRRKRKSSDRWWRISDDKIKECKTSEVLAMQKEVYLLFYELERPGDELS